LIEEMLADADDLTQWRFCGALHDKLENPFIDTLATKGFAEGQDEVSGWKFLADSRHKSTLNIHGNSLLFEFAAGTQPEPHQRCDNTPVSGYIF